MVTPHVWLFPAEMDAHASSMTAKSQVEITTCGVGWSRYVKSPSWPEAFHPQQLAAPVVVCPHVKSPPALTLDHTRPPLTATGLGLEVTVVSSPSLP